MADEFDLISRYFKPLAGPEGLGLTDDAACVPQANAVDSIVTKDLLIEGIHFRTQDPVDLIARKALAVNVSDCVAKGAVPYLYWLGLALPKRTNHTWLTSFSSGLAAAQRDFGCSLAGGDTTATTGPVVISITLMGTISAKQMILRSGASEGDDIYVSGTVGDAALGLWCLENNELDKSELITAYQQPSPPVLFGQRLKGLASASADISDGLLADAGHIASASNVGMAIWQNKLPLSTQAAEVLQSNPDMWSCIWAGGDDYQIVFTAPPAAREKITSLANETGSRISLVGKVSAGQGVQLLDRAGEIVQVASGGYTHF